MQYTEGTIGRVFVLRLEDGEVLNDTIELFAREHAVACALVTFLGGSAGGSRVVVGPDAAQPNTVVPLVHTMEGSREALAVGTLIPNDTGEPVLHMHAACGREGDAAVGCTRAGLATWLTGEMVLVEITGARAIRKRDPASGFELLDLP